MILRGPNPQYFPSLTQSVYSPLSWTCNTGVLHLSTPGLPGTRTRSKPCHASYEVALQRLRPFSLVSRRLRGGLICMYSIKQGLLGFPCNAAFACPTRSGLQREKHKGACPLAYQSVWYHVWPRRWKESNKTEPTIWRKPIFGYTMKKQATGRAYHVGSVTRRWPQFPRSISLFRMHPQQRSRHARSHNECSGMWPVL